MAIILSTKLSLIIVSLVLINIIFYTWILTRVPDVAPETRNLVETFVDDARICKITSISSPFNPDTLVLVLTKNAESWGKRNNINRSIQDFNNLINSTYPIANLSLGILTSNLTEYKNYTAVLKEVAWERITVIYHPGYRGSTHRDGEERHNNNVQKERRRLLARLRNYLMLSAINGEKHIFWIDADIHSITNGILQKMISHSESKTPNITFSSALKKRIWIKSGEKVGLLTARCLYGDNPNYDLNAFSGPRVHPNASEIKALKRGEIFVPRGTNATKFMRNLTHLSSNEEIFRLDSVGGTLLYIRGELIRQGLTFPTLYIVGTDWELSEGWDGIETEGLCYVAKTLGYGCYGLGGSWVVEHLVN